MAFTLTPTQLRQEPNLDTEDFFLNMGPHHPSTHGVLRVLLRMNGEIVQHAVPYFGYLHRCFEKKAESLKYAQVVPYTDRWDYLAAMSNNMAYCLAVEKLLGIAIPRRADLIRVLTLELQRLASHMFWLAAFGNDLGSTTMLMYCMREREKIIDIYEMMCGARLTYHYIRIGGVMRDWDSRMDELCRNLMAELPKRINEYEDLFTGNEIFRMRVDGVGYMSAEDAIAMSATGPYLRASGVPYDLRKTQPYSLYPEIEFDIHTSDKCDCLGRYEVRLNEMYESVGIIRQALDLIAQTSPGEIIAPELPKVIKPPAGEVYSAIESPRGELGVYLVSDGSDKPYRCHSRAPSFVNLTSINHVGSGCMIADFIAILGSVDIVLGEV
ncbi:MAG TPA: NADH-quinone oxidoreductase subunit D, partial [Firmicutes bacterium]|nr:NADH-quinone oxidoreductase subunit D [Bacillota bacterium]